MVMVVSTVFVFLYATNAAAYQQGHTLFGDLKVDESKMKGVTSLSYTISLLTIKGQPVERAVVAANGRYRFFNIPNGEYLLIVETGSTEVARIQFLLQEKAPTDIRRDLELQWKPDFTGPDTGPPKYAPPLEAYARGNETAAKFELAQKAGASKDYPSAVVSLREIVAVDPNDFAAWGELGTMLFRQQKLGEAEKAYRQALALRPTYAVALLNLGKLQLAQKNNDAAVETFSKLVELHPLFAEAQLFLGEAYLQVKKGSKAVVNLNEALRLDPIGMAEAHLRLATLYNAAGMKDRAAAEYEQFIAKKPDYPDKAKLQNYIRQNKKCP